MNGTHHIEPAQKKIFKALIYFSNDVQTFAAITA
jgi:hypothetical protein